MGFIRLKVQAHAGSQYRWLATFNGRHGLRVSMAGPEPARAAHDIRWMGEQLEAVYAARAREKSPAGRFDAMWAALQNG